jgi:hypothetical protein
MHRLTIYSSRALVRARNVAGRAGSGFLVFVGMLATTEAQQATGVLSPSEMVRLRKEIISGHRLWQARLSEVSGCAQISLTNYNGGGGRSAWKVCFWQKESRYREDVLTEDQVRTPRFVTILTPERMIEANLSATPPSVSVRRPSAVPFPRNPLVRKSLNFVVMGFPDGLVRSLQEGEVELSEAVERIQRDGAKSIVAKLALTEKGAQAAGLPSVPPERWRNEIVHLAPDQDYAITTYEYTGYDATTASKIHIFVHVEVAKGAQQEWVLRSVLNRDQITQVGTTLEDSEARIRFVDLKYGAVDDAVFTLEGLGLSPDTLIHDEVGGKEGRWEDWRTQVRP